MEYMSGFKGRVKYLGGEQHKLVNGQIQHDIGFSVYNRPNITQVCQTKGYLISLPIGVGVEMFLGWKSVPGSPCKMLQRQGYVTQRSITTLSMKISLKHWGHFLPLNHFCSLVILWLSSPTCSTLLLNIWNDHERPCNDLACSNSK